LVFSCSIFPFAEANLLSAKGAKNKFFLATPPTPAWKEQETRILRVSLHWGPYLGKEGMG